MRIALLSFEYPPETGFGGIGTYTWHHARALAQLGHEVHVLAGAVDSTPLRSTDDEGVRVHRFWADGTLMRALAQLGAWRWWWTRQRLQNAWSMYLGLSELLRQHRFDILEMPECGAEGAWITRRLRIPTVVRLHSPSRLIMPYYEVARADLLLCSAVERQAMQRATMLTACSRFVADETRSKLGIRRDCHVISNGLDLDWMDAAVDQVDMHTRLGLPRRALTIVFCGRLERRKGIHLCAEIAASILERFDVTLVFAGDDLFGFAETTLLPALAGRTLKGSLHLTGRLGMSNLRSLVRCADIVLLPSLWENCPYSCLEAMAMARAVVAANQGGMPELIQDGINGLLATVDDAPAFVRCLERLIVDGDLRARLGQAARSTIQQRHCARQLARAATDVYETAIAGQIAPPR